MKRTLRGQLTSGETRRILIDDGDFTHGFIVRALEISPVNPLDETNSAATSAILHIAATPQSEFDWGSPVQVAWATYNTNPVNTLTVIDPDHVVVQELYITNLNATNPLNYMIHIEDKMLGPARAVLQMVKEVTYND